MRIFYPLCELGLNVFPVMNPSGIFCFLHVSSGDVRVCGGWCLVMVDGHVVLDDGASFGGVFQYRRCVFQFFSYASVLESSVSLSSPVVPTMSITLPDLKSLTWLLLEAGGL
jgi:hypothetical protein